MLIKYISANRYRGHKNIGAGFMRFLLSISSIALLAFSQSSIVFAATPPPCPSGMNPLDCQAVQGGWVDWVPVTATGCSSSSTGSGTTVLQGNDNIQKAFNYFVSMGLSTAQSAGIVGNLWQESAGVNPAIGQTANAWNDMNPDYGNGVGIAQWDGPRRVDLINKAKAKNINPKDLAYQLDYLWNELTTTYVPVLQHLRAATTVDDATNQFVGPNNLAGQPVQPQDEVARSGGYENPSTPQMKNRLDYANKVASAAGNTSGSSSCATTVSCNSGTTTATAGLSTVRQNAVCIAKQELAAWTPPPAVPRMQYTKYTTGWECNDGAQPTGSTCPAGNEFWSADFVSWVYKQAGYPFSGGLNGGWRLRAVDEVKNLPNTDSNWHWHAAAGYTPKPGDLAIHLDSTTGYSRVNIVVDVNGTTITLIGGDQGSGPYGGPNSASVVSEAVMQSSTDDSTVGYTTPD